MKVHGHQCNLDTLKLKQHSLRQQTTDSLHHKGGSGQQPMHNTDGGRTKSCTTHPVKYKKASKMRCKGPFDARFEAIETSRRALSDYAIQNAQKRNFSKMACSFFLPQNTGTKYSKNQEHTEMKIRKKIKKERSNNEKRKI